MEMHQVRYVLALCREGSFVRAAKRCGIAQPSLTKGIQNLEAELGGTMFHRTQRGVTLTALGTRLWPHFLSIEQSVAVIKSEPKLVSFNPKAQPLWRKELAMSRNLLLSAVILLPLVGIGGFIGTSWSNHQAKPGPVAVITIDPHALHLAVDASALPEMQVREPF